MMTEACAQQKRALIHRRGLSVMPAGSALLEFLAATELRASEVAGLTVGDVELNERSGWATVQGKGRKQRRVPIHARARRALSEYLEERNDPAGDEPLFLSQKRWSHQLVSCMVHGEEVRRAGRGRGCNATHVPPHGGHAARACPEVDPVTAATFLGHSRLDTTARYSQPSEEVMRDRFPTALVSVRRPTTATTGPLWYTFQSLTTQPRPCRLRWPQSRPSSRPARAG
jgi:integrase/recombinase XerC